MASFLEKPRPEEIDTNLINAGLYVLEPSVLELIPAGRAVSIEREVFPRLCAEGSVYGLSMPGYWLDVGTPDSYLQAHRDVLERRFRTEVGDELGGTTCSSTRPQQVHPEARLVPRFRRRERADRCRGLVGSLAVVGAGAVIGAGAIVESSVVGAGATVGGEATIMGSILGEGAQLGDGCHVLDLSVVGPGAGCSGERAEPRAAARRRCRDPRRGGELRMTDAYRFTPRRIDKPWGYELIWAESEDYVGKVLFVRAGQALSLQYHEQKDESWLVQDGRASLELGQVGGELTAIEIVAGDAFRYRPLTVHRVTAIEDTTILEVSTPHLDDVVRIDDRYGRPERDK